MPDPDESDGLPEDPFAHDIPDSILDKASAEDIAFLRGFLDASYDFSALLHQQTFRELLAAVQALSDEQVRAVVVRAITTSIYLHMKNPDRFAAWLTVR